ncbi:MAG: S8 family serine peptidase [Pseudomonadota bacterium]
MTRLRMRHGQLPGMIVIFTMISALTTADPARTPRSWLHAAIQAVCPLPDLTGFDAQLNLSGSWLLDERREPGESDARRITVHLALPGAELMLERRQANGVLRQFRASYFKTGPAGRQPVMLAIADGGCTVQSARMLRSEGTAWRFLDQLGGDMETLLWTETLQSPWPAGQDPGGIRIALVDSGLAFDLPAFRHRLARDRDGQPLGYDFWDLDPWPYDADTSRGPFLPIRHGTAVASVLVREAPDAALVPFRYPRPDMDRMADVVARAAAAGARILAMPLGSRNRRDWIRFEQALAAHDILAIVSAGNDGRDIDAAPVFPAALTLENILTVTSSDGFGRLAQGSNWGATSVDIMLPAENIEITDFRGATGVASGSSYAVPRLAALAARLLAREPGLSAAELKSRILDRAAPSPFERAGVVWGGWIPDPLAD